MHTDAAFMSKLLENPADDTARLVYPDWLDERGDEQSSRRAMFLRTTVALMDKTKNAGWRKARRKELQQLAAGITDAEWLAVVSRLKVENCGVKRPRVEPGTRWIGDPPPLRIDFECDRRWDELRRTDEVAVRFWDGCLEHV